MPEWHNEARTAIALELAAAKLLACCAMPVMPRFAARLAAALGIETPDRWPSQVTLVPPGSAVDLAGQVFFAAPLHPEADAEAPPAEGARLAWLSGLVRETLRLPPDAPVAGATLVSLGAESMQAIALAYQILEGTGADVPVTDLLGDYTVAQLAASLEVGA
jgi:methionyl-tRNA synthetase